MSFLTEEDIRPGKGGEDLFFLSQTGKFQGPVATSEQLLTKCKETIEELVNEIDNLKREKAESDDKMQEMHKEITRKTTVITDMRSREELMAKEIQDLKVQFITMKNKCSLLESESHVSRNADEHIRQLQEVIEGLRKDLTDKVMSLDEYKQELRERDNMILEWNSEMDKISRKILDLEAENEAFRIEKGELIEQFTIKSETLSLIERKYDEVRSHYEREVSDLTGKLREKEDIEGKLLIKYKNNLEEIDRQFREAISQVQAANETLEKEVKDKDEETKVLRTRIAKLEEFQTEREEKQKKDIHKLQSLVDEQYELIRSYEKIIKQSKQEFNEKSSENEKLKSKVEDLAKKLQNCQDEIQGLHHQMQETFALEDKKQKHITEKIRALEEAHRIKEAELKEKDKEIKKMTEKLDVSKAELEDILNNMDALTSENRKLKEGQGEYTEKFKRNFEEMCEKIKEERQRRIDAENATLTLEEKFRKAELEWAKQIESLQDELIATRRELFKSNKVSSTTSPFVYAPAPEKVAPRETYTIDLMPSPKENYERVGRELPIRQPNEDLRRTHAEGEIHGQTSSALNKTDKVLMDKSKREDFINKFRNAISRIENKLTKISEGMNEEPKK